MKNEKTNFFIIKDLSASIEKKQVINKLNLEIQKGDTHVIMGPNGSGKSSIAKIIMGHPSFKVLSGEIVFEDENMLTLSPDKRAQKGIFLAFQYPKEISGVTLETFLRASYIAINKAKDSSFVTPSVFKFRSILEEKMDLLHIDKEFAKRSINKNFSGGEKKKVEILQMILLHPKLIILDEIDSGLDIDALKIVANSINQFRKEKITTILITHYPRLLEYIKPDKVHVMRDGTIIKSGGTEFIDEIQEQGFEEITN